MMIHDENLPNVLANSSNRSLARLQVSNMFTVNFMFCPPRENSWRFQRSVHAGDFLVSKRSTAYVGLVRLQKFKKL